MNNLGPKCQQLQTIIILQIDPDAKCEVLSKAVEQKERNVNYFSHLHLVNDRKFL